jgi:hypothetical protein
MMYSSSLTIGIITGKTQPKNAIFSQKIGPGYIGQLSFYTTNVYLNWGGLPVFN